MTQQERDQDFARLLENATLAEIEDWAADMEDPDSGFYKAPEWKHEAVRRRFKEITGKELGT